ncbi:MAG TPA: hypothetical protein VM075_05470 [Anaerolineae bacterium]|nr:hypothetical protein [Anaerolineae bacterium]
MMEVDGLTKRQGGKAATRDLTFLSVGLFTSSLIRDQAVTPLLGSGAMRILWLVDVAVGTSGLPATYRDLRLVVHPLLRLSDGDH